MIALPTLLVLGPPELGPQYSTWDGLSMSTSGNPPCTVDKLIFPQGGAPHSYKLVISP